MIAFFVSSILLVTAGTLFDDWLIFTGTQAVINESLSFPLQQSIIHYYFISGNGAMTVPAMKAEHHLSIFSLAIWRAKDKK